MLYHGVYRRVPGALQQGFHNVTPEVFADQVRRLRQDFEVVSVDDWFAANDRRAKACITFDDGYLSVFSDALPLLLELGIPATVFIVAATLDGKVFWRDKVRYLMSCDRVAEFIAFLSEHAGTTFGLEPGNFYRRSKHPSVNSVALDRSLDAFFVARGPEAVLEGLRYCVSEPGQLIRHPLVSYGNHGYGHYVLASLSDQQQRDEIARGAERLAALKLNCSRIFSLPFGDRTDVNATTFGVLREQGYAGALLSRNRLNVGDRLATTEGVPCAERYMAGVDPDALEATHPDGQAL